MSLIGLFYLKSENLSEFNPSGQPLLASMAALAPLTMFAYLGMESATVPAGDVRDAKRTIPRSTVLGIVFAALFYVLGTVVVFGVVPREQLVHSVAPFSDAARIMWGPWGGNVIAFAVILSSIGALNGWTLTMGQVPMAAARDRLFPSIFGRMSSRGVPAVGIVISALLATALLLLAAEGATNAQSLLQPGGQPGHDGRGGALRILRARGGPDLGTRAGAGKAPRLRPVEWIAFVFSIFTIYGCGPQAVLYGLILLLLGIPVYVWLRRSAPRPKGIKSC